MRWSQKTTAKNSEWLAQVAAENPKLKVKTLEDKPTLFPHLNWVWEAFGELNYRRGVSMSGAVPITMTDIEAYCRFRGINNPQERDRFLKYVRVLDQEWMTKHYEESDRKQNSSATKPQKPNFNRQR